MVIHFFGWSTPLQCFVSTLWLIIETKQTLLITVTRVVTHFFCVLALLYL